MKAIGAIAITAVVVLAMAVTWVIARSTARSEVATVRSEIAACEQRAAARHADDLRVVDTAKETSRRAHERTQELEIKNQQLEQEIERKATETVAQAQVPGRPAEKEKRNPRKASATTPQQTFDLSPGEQKSIIPGVLSVAVAQVLPTSAEVEYGGHPRHLNVGENVTVNYLGLPCVLTLAEIKNGNNGAPIGSFAFSFASKGDSAVGPASPGDGATPVPLPPRRR